MSAHTIHFTHDGEWIHAEIACHAAPEDRCRNYGESEEDAWADGLATTPGQECIYLPWFGDGPLAGYDGEAQPVRDGAPIEFYWQGYYLTWDYRSEGASDA